MMERFWEVYNANDMDAFQSFFADDFVNFTPAPGFDPTAAGFAQTMSFFRAGFPDQQAVVNEIVVDGDMVVSRVTLRGTHTAFAFGIEATGRVVTYGGLEVTRVRDGKFIEAWGFYDQVSILLQLGLIPGGAPPPATPVAAASPVGSPTAGDRINWEAYSQLEVTGSEDGFTAPDSIAGGLVALTFENTGTTNHMAMLIRPKSGTTIDELEAAIKSDPLNQVIIREMVDLSGGAGGIAPGMRQRVIMPVEPGQYLLADFELADDGAPFVTKNGLKRLEVTPATGATPPEPPADVTVGMIDFAFTEIPSALTAGTYIIKVTADGTEPHELAFVKLAEGVSVQDAFAQAPQPGQPLPFTFWGGVQDIAPGTVAWIETEFSPGTYVAFCPIIDPDTNRQHLLLGMVHTITVE